MIDGALTGGVTASKARAFETREELAKKLDRMVKPGDVILVKGSRGMHMELVLEQFLKKEK